MTRDNLKHVLFLLIVLVLMAPSLKSQVTVPAELTLRQAKDILVANSPLLQAEKMNQEIARGVFIDVSKRPNLELSVSAVGLGSVSLLEFLDAERTYGEAVRRYNRALYELQVSWAQLEFTVGRDLP